MNPKTSYNSKSIRIFIIYIYLYSTARIPSIEYQISYAYYEIELEQNTSLKLGIVASEILVTLFGDFKYETQNKVLFYISRGIR